jgi:hypothetical protein
MSRELDLLLECLRRRWNPSAAQRIAVLVEEGVDWNQLLQRARLHRVMPLVHTSLSAVANGAIPPSAAEELQASFRASARNGLALSGHLLQLVRFFEQEGIPVLPFKGPLLAKALYGDLSLRSFGDLDVLIDQRDIGRAREALINRGYVAGWANSDWEFHFDAPSGGHTIDLHHRIAPSHFPSPGSFQELWERRQPVPILNTAVCTLAPEDLLLSLSVELVRDCQERKPRLVQICDVAALLTTSPALDWEGTLAHASAIGCRRILLLDLLLARTLLGVELPGEVMRAVGADRTMTRLAGYAATQLLARVDVPSSTAALDTRFYLRTRERAGDKLRYLHYRVWGRLRPLITPSEKDLQFLRLPPRLSFLHYAVRPIRVISDHVTQKRLSRRLARRAANAD